MFGNKNEEALNELFPGAGPEPSQDVDLMEDSTDALSSAESESTESAQADSLMDALNQAGPEDGPVTEESPEDMVLIYIPSTKVETCLVDGRPHAYGFLNGDRVEVPCNTSVEIARKHANLFKAKLEQ